MKIEFDPLKNIRNILKHQRSFKAVAMFDWDNAMIVQDVRKDYPEKAGRMVAYGFIAGRLHILCFTPIFDGVRAISLRRANKKEVRAYEQAFD